MANFLLILQMVISVLMILAILVQTKGTGFGRVWGSGPKSFTRRGLENVVFKATFVLVGLLMVVSILQLLIS